VPPSLTLIFFILIFFRKCVCFQVRLWTLTPPYVCVAATASAAAVAALEAALAKKAEKSAKGGAKAKGKASGRASRGGGAQAEGGDDGDEGDGAADGSDDGEEGGGPAEEAAGGAMVVATSTSTATGCGARPSTAAAAASSGFRITCLAPMGSVMWAVGQDQSIGVWDRRPLLPGLRLRPLLFHSVCVRVVCVVVELYHVFLFSCTKKLQVVLVLGQAPSPPAWCGG
jgi:hypothetical protein